MSTEAGTVQNLVAVWREAAVFTEAERAALELTKQGTRIADAAHGVTDEAWANAAKHYDDDQLAALVSLIALINTYNRINVIARQPAGDYQPGSGDKYRSSLQHSQLGRDPLQLRLLRSMTLPQLGILLPQLPLPSRPSARSRSAPPPSTPQHPHQRAPAHEHQPQSPPTANTLNRSKSRIPPGVSPT